MAASVVAGVHGDIAEAQEAMGGGFELEYHPDKDRAQVYARLYEKYKKLGTFIESETH